jgi:hypothetical protein
MSTNARPAIQDDFSRVLNPDSPEHFEEFVFGKNKDNSPRKWQLRPLGYHHEKYFRKCAMPLLANAYRPFETLVGAMSQQFYTAHTPSVLDAIVEAETRIDDDLTAAVHAILVSQDKDITRDWVESNAESRDQMMSLVEKQADLHKLMDRLGESLAERLNRLARMLGFQIDLPTLKQLWKQLSADFSAKITNFVSTGPNVYSRFTESLSPISTNDSKSKSKNRGKTLPVEEVPVKAD